MIRCTHNEPRKRASSARKTMVAMVERYRASLVRLTFDIEDVGSGRKNRIATVPDGGEIWT